MNISNKLKYIRGVLLISQQELAQRLKIAFCTINRLENGRNKANFITEKKIEKFCKENNIVIEEREYE